jgi:hypothetical protein
MRVVVAAIRSFNLSLETYEIGSTITVGDLPLGIVS